MLKPGILKILGPNEQRILVVGGFAEVSPEGLTVLADRAMPVDEVDPAVLAGEIKDAEEDVADAKDDAARDKLRLKLDQLRAVQAVLGN
jgi:F-type H+-transporting ATPase subunit epsilon